MKKVTFLTMALFALQITFAQSVLKGWQSVVVKQTEQRERGGMASQQILKSTKGVTFSGDVIIENGPAIDQGKVKLSVAFNGWVYSAFSTYNSAGNLGGISIRKSKDNGVTWTTVDSYASTNITYPAYDIVVAGTDSNNLTLYLIGVNSNSSSGTYILFVDRYDATTGNFIGSNYNTNAGTNKVYDVAIASDYSNPSVSSAPYSVAFLYSKYGSTNDSVNYVASVDGGTSWTQFQNVMFTGGYARKVSISYGKSVSASNGRFFAAWEILGSSSARTGHIYTSRNSSSPITGFIAPVNLDSISATMINLCRNPSIATQFNNLDNDSSSVSAVVMVDRDYVGDGSDYDLLGFYNMRSHFTNFWSRLDVVNSSENDYQPNLNYDPAANKFLLTYYDSTNSKLPYLVHDFNIGTNPSTWTTVNPQYNDLTTNLNNPWPCVEINPALGKAALAWTAKNGTGNGVAMFDAEYNTVGINENSNSSNFAIYPNPSNGLFTLTCSENISSVKAFDILGKEMEVTKLSGKAYTLTNAVNGAYFIKIITEKGEEKTEKLIIK